MLAQPFTKKTLIIALILIAALITLSFAVFPKTNRPYPDYALRHPGQIALPVTRPANFYQGSDWYERHRGEVTSTGILDMSDYFLRHPELREVAGISVDTSDYFLRHPELNVPAITVLDTTDYFLRHPELRASAPQMDTSDYYLRHPELSTH